MSNANDEALIRMLWELSGKGRRPGGTHRDPTSAERKRIVRWLRAKPRSLADVMAFGMRKRCRDPSPPISGMQFVDTLLHAGDLARADPAFRGRLKTIQNKGVARGYLPDLYRYLPKPWKGRAGRETYSQDKQDRRALALRLIGEGLSVGDVARRLRCTERTIRNYKNGR